MALPSSFAEGLNISFHVLCEILSLQGSTHMHPVLKFQAFASHLGSAGSTQYLERASGTFQLAEYQCLGCTKTILQIEWASSLYGALCL